jgi:hypothetical protein
VHHQVPQGRLDAGIVSVRRSAGVVRNRGEAPVIIEGDTKSGKPRVVDLDAGTVGLLRACRRERGAMAPQLARDDALVFGDHEGRARYPEGVSRGSGWTSPAAARLAPTCP